VSLDVEYFSSSYVSTFTNAGYLWSFRPGCLHLFGNVAQWERLFVDDELVKLVSAFGEEDYVKSGDELVPQTELM
jgi:hypothetical protein